MREARSPARDRSARGRRAGDVACSRRPAHERVEVGRFARQLEAAEAFVAVREAREPFGLAREQPEDSCWSSIERPCARSCWRNWRALQRGQRVLEVVGDLGGEAAEQGEPFELGVARASVVTACQTEAASAALIRSSAIASTPTAPDSGGMPGGSTGPRWPRPRTHTPPRAAKVRDRRAGSAARRSRACRSRTTSKGRAGARAAGRRCRAAAGEKRGDHHARADLLERAGLLTLVPQQQPNPASTNGAISAAWIWPRSGESANAPRAPTRSRSRTRGRALRTVRSRRSAASAAAGAHR